MRIRIVYSLKNSSNNSNTNNFDDDDDDIDKDDEIDSGSCDKDDKDDYNFLFYNEEEILLQCALYNILVLAPFSRGILIMGDLTWAR